jgi:uncharacterized membrane protein YccF (DUF307 family)
MEELTALHAFVVFQSGHRLETLHVQKHVFNAQEKRRTKNVMLVSHIITLFCVALSTFKLLIVCTDALRDYSEAVHDIVSKDLIISMNALLDWNDFFFLSCGFLTCRFVLFVGVSQMVTLIQIPALLYNLNNFIAKNWLPKGVLSNLFHRAKK